MTSAAVSVAGLTTRYGDRTAVDNIDIELPSGVVAGFVGPNGAAKTTTMAILLGLVRPTEGTGTVLGSSISKPAAYLPRVGALIEGPAFYASLSGAENLTRRATRSGRRRSSARWTGRTSASCRRRAGGAMMPPAGARSRPTRPRRP
jgi:ABC-2 type transport system ATP-binding protein